MYCTKCGKQISDDSLYCAYCGAPVQKASGPTRVYYEMSCKRCGYRFSVSESEYKRDKREKKRFRAGATLALLSGLPGGGVGDALWADYNMMDAANNIVDYSRCPHCRFKGVVKIGSFIR